MGSIITVKSTERYGFIGIGDVTRDDGSPHDLGTKKDIFIHQDACGTELRDGLFLTFEVEADMVRGDGYFRAKDAQEVVDVELLPDDGEVLPGFRLVTTTYGGLTVMHRHPAHLRMKDVPEDMVAIAAANKPLNGVPADGEETMMVAVDEVQLLAALADYLMRQFPGLHSIGITFAVTGYFEAEQDRLVADAISGCRDLGMDAQAVSTEEEYLRFKATRRMIAWILEQGWLQPGTRITPSVLTSMVKLVESLPSSTAKDEIVTTLQKLFGFMGSHGLIRSNTVVPIRYLPDLFCAAPVWFFALDQFKSEDARNNLDRAKIADPRLSRAGKDVCEIFPDNERWADAFLMFNRRTRPLQVFKGDIIPPTILRLIAEARAVFDHVVIMAPYLDVAGEDWNDLAWIRSIDPYVVGLKKGCPAFFILARFSDTGVFPLLLELVADTMSFLAANKKKLEGFNVVNNPYWYPGCKDQLGTHLIGRVDEMQRAFNAGHLFDWIRKEWSPETALAKA